MSGTLVTIGACATSGGIQALRNFADVAEFRSIVYAHPEYLDTLEHSTAIADHVPVDFELRGCPVDKRQLLEVLTAFVARPPPAHPGAQRLRRVQAARQRLRDRRARHAVPRPGDPGRLRRAVPRVLPRLLRLLRAAGHRRTPARSRRGWPSWACPSATCCGSSARSPRARLSSATRAAATPRPRRGDGMTHKLTSGDQVLKANPLARVEGEGAMHVVVREGRVADVELRIFEPPRFFEAFLRGRAYTEPPGHHRPDLRDLPGRLPDELLPGDRAGLRRRGDRGDPADAPAALLRRVDREPRAAHLPAARAGLPRLRRRRRDGRRPPRPRRARPRR